MPTEPEIQAVREALDAEVERLGDNLAAAETDEEFDAAEKELTRFIVDLIEAWNPGQRMRL